MNLNTNDESVKKEVSRVVNIKFFITVVAIAGMVALCILFWNEDGTYQIELEANKNEGYQWMYTIEDEGIVAEQQAYYANGLYVFVFEGLEEGEAEVKFSLTKDNEKSQIEGQIHTLKVNKDNRIIVKKISEDK